MGYLGLSSHARKRRGSSWHLLQIEIMGFFGLGNFFPVYSLGMDIGYLLATQILPAFHAKPALGARAGGTPKGWEWARGTPKGWEWAGRTPKGWQWAGRTSKGWEWAGRTSRGQQGHRGWVVMDWGDRAAVQEMVPSSATPVGNRHPWGKKCHRHLQQSPVLLQARNGQQGKT